MRKYILTLLIIIILTYSSLLMAQTYVNEGQQCQWNNNFPVPTCQSISCPDGNCKIRAEGNGNVLVCWCDDSDANYTCSNFSLDNSLTINITGFVTHNGISESISSNMNLTLNPQEVCNSSNGFFSATNQDCNDEETLAWLIPAAKVAFWLIKTAPDANAPGTCVTANAFDLSCGELSGTFQMGIPPQDISGSYTMSLAGTNIINITNLNITANNTVPYDFTGSWTTQENITPTSPGIVSVTGVSYFETVSNGIISSPYNATYSLDGNPTAILPNPLTVNQSVQFDCATGSFNSTICFECPPYADIPTLSQWSLIIFTLLMLIVAIVGIRGKSNDIQLNYKQ